MEYRAVSGSRIYRLVIETPTMCGERASLLSSFCSMPIINKFGCELSFAELARVVLLEMSEFTQCLKDGKIKH